MHVNASMTEDDKIIASAFNGILSDVIPVLEKKVNDEPDNYCLLTSLGIANARAGRFGDAVTALQRAVELSPSHILSKAYLGICLCLDGQDANALELLDYDGSIQIEPLFPDFSMQELNKFNCALVDHVHSHPSLTWLQSGKATKGGSQTGELLCSELAPVMQQFHDALCASLSSAFGSPESFNLASWHLTIWGVSLCSGGYQEPHVHQSGVISGVYYAQVPNLKVDSNAGALLFPRKLPWLAKSANDHSLSAFLIQPQAGMLVLFPSYFWHETVPFDAGTKRVSIAFDVLPVLNKV